MRTLPLLQNRFRPLHYIRCFKILHRIRFAFTQSFRSLRCVSAGCVSGILILSLGEGKKEGQLYRRLAFMYML